MSRIPLKQVYKALLNYYGPQRWWPGRTRLEVIVGAILTQNCAWANVEKAIRRLRREKALNLRTLNEVDESRLAEWIKPSGYFNVKARRLRAFTTMVKNQFDGKLDKLLALETGPLRKTLLAVNGIGPETADSILLYAARRPVFVVDAYTRRFLLRHGWIKESATYDDIAALFTRPLPAEEVLFNEYHALVVALGKHHCKTKPDCDTCPLRRWLPPKGPVL